MKTRLLLISIAGLTNYALAQTQSYVYTPRGSTITDSWILPEATDALRSARDNYWFPTQPPTTRTKLIYPGETFSSSDKFNCHGYAWHMHEGGSMRWIGWQASNGEDTYMTDGSYIKVCNEVFPGKVSWGSDDHSAVTTATPGRWISKFGPGAYLIHDYNDTPYNNSIYNYYSSTTITGPLLLCNAASGTFSVGPGATYSWSCGGGLVATSGNNGQNYTVQPNIASGIGWVQVTITSGCDGRSIVSTKNVNIGPPKFSHFLVNGQQTSNATVCVNNFASIEAQPYDNTGNYSWSLSNSGNAYLTNYNSANTSFNAYTADCYGLSLQISNSCGTTQGNLTICAQNCFARYTVSPNSAKDVLTVTFEPTEDASALPDEITLVREKTILPVKTVNVQELAKTASFTQDRKVIFQVGDLPRGIYYIQVKNPRRKDKELDVIRILLE